MTQARKHRGVTMAPKRGGLRLPPAHIRIATKVEVTTSGCWEYPTNRNQKGYARLTVGGKQTLVHRFMYEHYFGPIPEGQVVCHSCDNPPCCNVDHLFLGTIADNNRDMWGKGRGKLAPPSWRKIPLDQVPVIVSRFQRGDTKQAIANDYGVSRQAIHYILKREGVL